MVTAFLIYMDKNRPIYDDFEVLYIGTVIIDIVGTIVFFDCISKFA